MNRNVIAIPTKLIANILNAFNTVGTNDGSLTLYNINITFGQTIIISENTRLEIKANFNDFLTI